MPAGALAITALTMGALAVALGVTLVWFFLALPFGLVAVGCALAERRHTRRLYGRTAGGVVTAGLVLGLASIPLALGGLVVIPQMQGFIGDSVADVNGVVASDLDVLERSFTKNVNDLDDTLSKNVNESTDSLSSDFTQLEASSQKELDDAETRLHTIITELEKASDADLSGLEESLRQSIASEREIIERIEADLRNDLANTKAEVANLQAVVAKGG